jgi:hypothetical protein
VRIQEADLVCDEAGEEPTCRRLVPAGLRDLAEERAARAMEGGESLPEAAKDAAPVNPTGNGLAGPDPLDV